jgi:HSP20 family molecular chaperone IbpA
MNHETTMQKRYPDVPEGIEQRPSVAPLVDIYENNDELLVVADLPGVAKDDLKVHVEKNQLTLEGRRTDGVDGEELAVEYRPYDFRRVFSVSQGIDADRINAELTQGVLHLHLPKVPAAKPRQIPIKTS